MIVSGFVFVQFAAGGCYYCDFVGCCCFEVWFCWNETREKEGGDTVHFVGKFAAWGYFRDIFSKWVCL